MWFCAFVLACQLGVVGHAAAQSEPMIFVHEHAAFALFIEGERVSFADEAYDVSQIYGSVHMHATEEHGGSIIHIEAPFPSGVPNVTLESFFAQYGVEFELGRLKLDSKGSHNGSELRDVGNHYWRVFVSRLEAGEPPSRLPFKQLSGDYAAHVIQDGDRILVTFGLDGASIEEQLSAIPDSSNFVGARSAAPLRETTPSETESQQNVQPQDSPADESTSAPPRDQKAGVVEKGAALPVGTFFLAVVLVCVAGCGFLLRKKVRNSYHLLGVVAAAFVVVGLGVVVLSNGGELPGLAVGEVTAKTAFPAAHAAVRSFDPSLGLLQVWATEGFVYGTRYGEGNDTLTDEYCARLPSPESWLCSANVRNIRDSSLDGRARSWVFIFGRSGACYWVVTEGTSVLNKGVASPHPSAGCYVSSGLGGVGSVRDWNVDSDAAFRVAAENDERVLKAGVSEISFGMGINGPVWIIDRAVLLNGETGTFIRSL